MSNYVNDLLEKEHSDPFEKAVKDIYTKISDIIHMLEATRDYGEWTPELESLLSVLNECWDKIREVPQFREDITIKKM